MTLKVTVQGATGRTGSLILQVIPEFDDLELCGAIVSRGSRNADAPVPGHPGKVFTTDKESAVANCDVIIDFSTPEASIEIAKLCEQHGKPLLIATTGFEDSHHEILRRASRKIPVLIAANTSIGVFAMHELVKSARHILGPSFDVEIFEIHHRHKKDAPSGTALSLARALQSEGEELVKDRSARTKPRGSEIGISSIRGGEVPGEHTVYFISSDERVEITHRASSRLIFARGALNLAKRLTHAPAGMHQLADLIGKKA